jgi:acyl-CoA reductase-like NAD-dependent aldehyde dehydrogenase
VASPDGRIDSAERAGQLGVRCPASGRIVGHVACMSATDVAVVAADLRRAQPGWQAMGAAGRGRVLLRWLDWILDNERRLLELLQAETGKSSGDAAIETTVAVDLINYYAKNSGRFLEDGHIAAHNLLGRAKRLRVRYEPYELVGQIFPWNYPVAMPMLDVPAALMAGAAVITKPSEATPLTWSEMVRGFREEIDAPAVLGAVTGDGAAGAAVVDEVDTIMFTGSTRTGRSVAVQAAQRLIPCSLELGGKDPMIVLGDANLDRAVAGAVWGGFSNAGQTCISVERVYVEDGIYDAFVTKLVGEVEKLRVGMDAPRSFSTDFGAIATEQQLQIIERHFHDALSKGARAITGGRRLEGGLFFAPTVLVDVDHSMLCMREETFGPILPVMRVASEHEAVRLANDSAYGLSSSVWTSNPARGQRVARQVQAGAVNINNAMANAFQAGLPFGGWKNSGIGSRFGGAEAVRKYCKRQAVMAERLNLKSELHWYPHRPRKAKFQSRMVRLIGAHDWRRRLG